MKLNANPTGGSGYTGNFQYSWTNGSKYWDGSGFNAKVQTGEIHMIQLQCQLATLLNIR